MKRDEFDPTMDSLLLAKNFEYYDDWAHGPMSGWYAGGYYSLKLMKHAHGYWLILMQSGRSGGINIGSSNDAEDIIDLRDSLIRLW